MDQFDYLRTSDKESTGAGNDSVETLTNTKSGDQVNAKTEQYVENIEQKVDELYSSLEKNTSSGWKSFNGFLTDFQKNIPQYVNQTKDKLEKLSIGEAEISEQEKQDRKVEAAKYLNLIKQSTTTYLDELDNDLQEVEKLVGGFASRFGSFLKDAITIDEGAETKKDTSGKDEDELEEDESKILFNVPDSKIFGTRAEQRIHELNNSKDLYMKDALNKDKYEAFTKDFKINESETKKALENRELNTLYQKLVPSELTGDQFWLKYFYNKDLIDAEENTRKKLLSKSKPGQNDDEEKFDWDDDDEEETEQPKSTAQKAESRTSSEVTYNLESANSSTLDVVASKREAKKDEKKNEDEEEDDDWE